MSHLVDRRTHVIRDLTQCEPLEEEEDDKMDVNDTHSTIRPNPTILHAAYRFHRTPGNTSSLTRADTRDAPKGDKAPSASSDAINPCSDHVDNDEDVGTNDTPPTRLTGEDSVCASSETVATARRLILR